MPAFRSPTYKRSKAFYEKALAPLGYILVMEVPQTENDTPAAGFGIDRKPDFWIGGEGGLNRPVHIAIAAKDRAAVDALLSGRYGGEVARTTAPRAYARHYHPNYYAAFVFDPDGHNIEAVCHSHV